jgi:hypothetical protein
MTKNEKREAVRTLIYKLEREHHYGIHTMGYCSRCLESPARGSGVCSECLEHELGQYVPTNLAKSLRTLLRAKREILGNIEDHLQ